MASLSCQHIVILLAIGHVARPGRKRLCGRLTSDASRAFTYAIIACHPHAYMIPPKQWGYCFVSSTLRKHPLKGGEDAFQSVSPRPLKTSCLSCFSGPYQYLAALTVPTAALLSVFGGTFGHEAVLALCGYLPMPQVCPMAYVLPLMPLFVQQVC